MNRKQVRSTVDKLTQQFKRVIDPVAISIINKLFNLMEMLVEENEAQARKIQALTDEINHLKGEQGKPRVRKQTNGKKDNDDNNHSSEKERKKREGSKKPRKPGGTKKSSVHVDRSKDLKLDKEILPEGGHSNGIVTTVVQDIKFETDNIEFRRETCYVKETRQHFIAPLPDGYDTEYGPNIKAFIKTAYSKWQITIGNIALMLICMGIKISRSTVSRMLLAHNEVFHQEKDDIVKAGTKATPWQHCDDTSGREKGQNRYVNVLNNPYYTAYFTLTSKDRLSLIELLSFDGLNFSLNQSAVTLMQDLGLPTCYLKIIDRYITTELLTRSDMDSLLKKLFPDPGKHKKNRKVILEACAITAYQSSDHAITHLIVDDAPQFKEITTHLGLCWVHEGRHYKKMNPVIEKHIDLLDVLIEQFWDYYKELLDYKKNPSLQLAKVCSERFDTLFSQTTGYEKLDKQLALTLAKKVELLLVLKFPFIPLHNNSAELGARVQARTRDIHLHTMSNEGTKTKDTLATLYTTADKLGVNFYLYFLDRITHQYKMPSLAEIIKQRSSSERMSHYAAIPVSL
jgi:hypothetical protein